MNELIQDKIRECHVMETIGCNGKCLVFFTEKKLKKINSFI